MIKASSNLQDPRRGQYGKRKAEWLRYYAKASDGSGGVVDGGSGHSDLGDDSWAVYESGSERIRLINLVVKCAGARSAGNPHAACEVAGAGNGATDTAKRARRGKPRIQPSQRPDGPPRQFPTLPNAWGGLSLDPERGIAYVQTGSAKPNFLGERHRGRNLFANCLLAIDVRTGKRLWHFQEIRHDLWDQDGTAPPVLTTITRNGKKYDVVAGVTKSGNTVLLDRVTGKPIYPFRLRRAPTSKVPGIITWPYQPDVELPEPFSRQQFTRDNVTDLSEESRQYMLDMFARDGATMGWMVPNALNTPNVVNNLHGGANWPGASVDPESSTLFVNSNDFPWYITITQTAKDFVDETKPPPTPGRKVYEDLCVVCHGPNREGTGEYPPLIGLKQRSSAEQVKQVIAAGEGLMPPFQDIQGPDLANLLDYLFERDRPAQDGKAAQIPERPRYAYDKTWQKLVDQDRYFGSERPWGKLNAIDLNTGKIKWQVPFGEYEELMAKGLPISGTENFGGSSVTAGGLVFATGALDKKLKAYDVDSGEELWQYTLPFGGTAPPSIYEADGRQFIVVPATGAGKLRLPPGDAYVAFALPDDL